MYLFNFILALIIKLMGFDLDYKMYIASAWVGPLFVILVSWFQLKGWHYSE